MARYLIEAPYFEPAPDAFYTVFADDDIRIELGEPIDPQGSKVSTNFILGNAQKFLKASGTNLALIQGVKNVTLDTYTIGVELRSEFEGIELSKTYKIDL